jgi:3',5'-cyclic AMP phosphodiesterase CpdA
VSVAGRRKTAKDSAPVQYHRVKLTGLKPYTRYEYSVKCGAERKSGSFVTAAPPGQPFKFAAYGDNRTQPTVHAAVLARMIQFQPDFIINSGDQVANGTNEAQWDEFWEITQKTLCQTPYYPSLGNHEKHGAPYFKYFDVPEEYSFDYGNAHFIALDTNRLPSEYGEQEAWLRKDLAAHQSATWRIVFFHHPIHTCVDKPARRVESAERAARLEPIFKSGKVQLVINGHDHDYQHHVASGIHYIVTGGGGAPLYSVTPNTPFVKVAKEAHHHCEITVNGSALSLRAIEPGGKIIEEFEMDARPESAFSSASPR